MRFRASKTDKYLPQIPFTGKLFSMTTFCITFYESYLSAAPLLTCRGHVGDSWRVLWRVIRTTAQEQLITCCAQVGAPSGGPFLPGEPRVIGTTAQEQLITCCAQVGA
jgi:hypothetical protein